MQVLFCWTLGPGCTLGQGCIAAQQVHEHGSCDVSATVAGLPELEIAGLLTGSRPQSLLQHAAHSSHQAHVHSKGGRLSAGQAPHAVPLLLQREVPVKEVQPSESEPVKPAAGPSKPARPTHAVLDAWRSLGTPGLAVLGVVFVAAGCGCLFLGTRPKSGQEEALRAQSVQRDGPPLMVRSGTATASFGQVSEQVQQADAQTHSSAAAAPRVSVVANDRSLAIRSVRCLQLKPAVPTTFKILDLSGTPQLEVQVSLPLHEANKRGRGAAPAPPLLALRALPEKTGEDKEIVGQVYATGRRGEQQRGEITHLHDADGRELGTIAAEVDLPRYTLASTDGRFAFEGSLSKRSMKILNEQLEVIAEVEMHPSIAERANGYYRLTIAPTVEWLTVVLVLCGLVSIDLYEVGRGASDEVTTTR